ncbi:unnamed protein product [Brugia pahangi]|uniref:Uncharacterized protein n=1 Tax=Brugia pahangi TaxID=6280 RepID=A0A0N4TPG1_BRUPA|nr:unnamed protein product [Brugia pahangi]
MRWTKVEDGRMSCAAVADGTAAVEKCWLTRRLQQLANNFSRGSIAETELFIWYSLLGLHGTACLAFMVQLAWPSWYSLLGLHA